MKARIVIILVLSLAAQWSLAQQTDLEAIAPDAKIAAARELLKQDMRPDGADVITGRDFQFSGPLVHPFKANKFREVPRRLFHLINPFARTEPGGEPLSARDLNPRAWTTTVGWSTGCSSSPVEVTHEPTLGLISVSRP